MLSLLKSPMNESLTEEEKGSLARAVMMILDSWGLNAAQQMLLLSLPDNIPSRVLRRYRDGTPFPENEIVNERIDHIIGISEALCTTYPHNVGMAYIWVKRTNKHFTTRPPIQIMVEDGLDGLLQIRSHLDCTFDWFNS